MTYPERLSDLLAESLANELDLAADGHCLRVDHVSEDAAVGLAEEIERRASEGVAAYVLTRRPAERRGISFERAIELRNRKRLRLCLFVPPGTADAAASSLWNSFKVFDLESFFTRAGKELLTAIPEEVRAFVVDVLGLLRGRAAVSAQRWAEYLATVAEDPTGRHAALSQWRVGLIPDAGEDPGSRIRENLRCVSALLRPNRPQASAEERLSATGIIAGQLQNRLLDFFRTHRVVDGSSWLSAIASEHEGSLTFEQWAFLERPDTDLEEIKIAPLLDQSGVVDKVTGLYQEAPGTQPMARVGPRAKVTIKWTSRPASPVNVRRWRAELVPSREHFSEEDAGSVELPAAQVSARTRRCSIKLEDLDLEVVPVRAVQIRVVALDEHSRELVFGDGPVEGISEEFWLTEGDGAPSLQQTKRDTVQTLPFGRVAFATSSGAAKLEAAPGRWTEDNVHFFSVLLNGRYSLRIGLSPALRGIEEDRILHATDAGCYDVVVDAAERVTEQHFTPRLATTLEGLEAATKLASRRKELFGLLEQQAHRALIEVADWTPELTKRVRSYANAYREALGSAPSPAVAAALTTIDTVRLQIAHGHGTERALLFLPTHPLRLLWYAAYAELLRDWEARLLIEDARVRRKFVDVALLRRVAPLNVPFVVHDEGTDYLFAQNLRFFWGVCLPIGVVDPGRRLADIAWAMGLTEDEAQLTDLPPARVAKELDSYLDVHPYAEVLRLNVLNPGAGAFLASVLRSFFDQRAAPSEEDGEPRATPKIEVIAQGRPPLPSKLAPIASLQESLYQAPPRPRVSHLSPLFSVSLREVSGDVSPPEGEANISFSIDQLRPTVEVVEEHSEDDSSSFYGLLLRLWPTFTVTDEGAKWVHRLELPADVARERHPTTPALTNELIESYRRYERAVATAVSGNGSMQPAIVTRLTPDERSALDRLHYLSDWVITLDRYLGVEYFDDPSDPDLARVARTYLLDYAPEFLEGIGHRMLVTTSQRDEVEAVLSRAMVDLGFGLIEESVGQVLTHLKTISGRLALRVVGNEARAREAVSLGVVAAYLRSQGELDDSILIPVDSHPELFGVAARAPHLGTPRSRCDLVRVRFARNRLLATFIETKSRTAAARSDELMNRIVDQIHVTEEVFKDLFFRTEAGRLDHVLQRSRLATILRFYLRRAQRHGLITSEERLGEMEVGISRLESGIPDMRVDRLGFVVNLAAPPDRPIRFQDVEIRLLTARDLAAAGLSLGTSVITSQAEAGDGPTVANARQVGPQANVAGDVPVPPATGPQMVKEAASASGYVSALSVAPAEAGVADTTGAEKSEGTGEPTAPATGFAVELGLTELDSIPVWWRPSLRGSPHLFVLGIPGQGKSWTVTRILTTLAEQGLPALTIDFHGQFRDGANPYIAVASPTVLDASMGLPFSPFEAEASRDAGASYWQTNAFAVAEIFQYVCGLGDIQRDVVYQAIADGYRTHGWEDGSPDGAPTVAEVKERLLELESQRGVRNVMPRMRPLLEFGLFDEGQPVAGFRDLLQRGMVLDVSRVGLESAQLGAAAFVLRKLYKDMFQWGDSDRLRLVLSLDEAHRLASDITLPKIMKEGRKFGLSVVVASQGLRDFHADVLGNSGTRVVFRTNFPMSKTVAGYFRAERAFDLAAAIEQLDVGEAYVQTTEMERCARVRMHPLS